MAKINFSDTNAFLNRELSFLAFNSRVLELTMNHDIPLLERLKFLCITASNLDEFFGIRVAGLKQQIEFDPTYKGEDGLTPAEQLQRISDVAHAFVENQYKILHEELFPKLRSEGIFFLRRSEWSEQQKDWLHQYFRHQLLPVLSPRGLDPAHPFPHILNQSLNFIVTLLGKDVFGRSADKAIVQAPRSLARVVRLPTSISNDCEAFVFLSSIIHAFVNELFPGMNVTGCFQFRCTRNSDLDVDDEAEDILRAVAGELHSRRFGDAVRLEVAAECPVNLKDFLRTKFDLDQVDVYSCGGPVNLTRLMTIPSMVKCPELLYKDFIPVTSAKFRAGKDMFAVIRQGDVLLHHPYESFIPVVDFIRQAANDPDVLTIRQTLYRTDMGSHLGKTLVAAARKGKEVTVIIELLARFDEKDNIELANELQEAGAYVTYGVVGYKTHAKMIMVVRREGSEIRRYVHLGTGNYHAKKALLYTDMGLFTCDAVIGQEVQNIFQQLMTIGRVEYPIKLLQAPFTMHLQILKAIKQESANVKSGKPARIIAKMNSLVEVTVIRELYKASAAGVKIDLIVRGVCTLRPGVEGLSENIRVYSVVGRFLEHSRIFYFENNVEPILYLSSADWMNRNFFKRIEIGVPIADPELRERIMAEGLLNFLDENSLCWLMQGDGTYKLRDKSAHKLVDVQDRLLKKLLSPKK